MNTHLLISGGVGAGVGYWWKREPKAAFIGAAIGIGVYFAYVHFTSK